MYPAPTNLDPHDTSQVWGAPPHGRSHCKLAHVPRCILFYIPEVFESDQCRWGQQWLCVEALLQEVLLARPLRFFWHAHHWSFVHLHGVHTNLWESPKCDFLSAWCRAELQRLAARLAESMLSVHCQRLLQAHHLPSFATVVAWWVPCWELLSACVAETRAVPRNRCHSSWGCDEACAENYPGLPSNLLWTCGGHTKQWQRCGVHSQALLAESCASRCCWSCPKRQRHHRWAVGVQSCAEYCSSLPTLVCEGLQMLHPLWGQLGNHPGDTDQSANCTSQCHLYTDLPASWPHEHQRPWKLVRPKHDKSGLWPRYVHPQCKFDGKISCLSPASNPWSPILSSNGQRLTCHQGCNSILVDKTHHFPEHLGLRDDRGQIDQFRSVSFQAKALKCCYLRTPLEHHT